MTQQCLCDRSSEEFSEDKKEDEAGTISIPNRIFLNFTRECRHPAKDRYNQEKVKELFKYLRERPDLQEMKVSGWLESEEDAEGTGNKEYEQDSMGKDDDREMDEGDDEEDDDECKNGSDLYYEEESSRKGGGQRFAMSRDFWYRKLNTLKARKLDETALEAEDLPPEDKDKPPKSLRYIKSNKIYADQVPQTKEDMFAEMEKFEREVGRPVEKNLKKNFVNVYDNREFFRKDHE